MSEDELRRALDAERKARERQSEKAGRKDGQADKWRAMYQAERSARLADNAKHKRIIHKLVNDLAKAQNPWR